MNNANQNIKKASSYNQYDKLNWKAHGSVSHPSRMFYREILFRYLTNLKNKKVIDIGSGVGHLFPSLKERGVSLIYGIEPFKGNYLISKKLYSNIPIINKTLEKSKIDIKFDIAISILVFDHFLNLDTAFKKVNSLLKTNGRCYILEIDDDYGKKPRFNYKINVRKIDKETSVVETKMTTETITYFSRPIKKYIEAAERNGFILEKHIMIEPSKKYIKSAPKYSEFVGTITHHLLIFKKVQSIG